MSVVREEKTYTIDDVYTLPEGQRAELIDGQIYDMAPPSSRRMDYLIKLFKYRNADVKEYWIVDPGKNRITAYNFVHDTIEEYAFGDDVPVGIYEDFSIKVSET